MKPLAGKSDGWRVPPTPNRRKPSGAWRKKYKCKKAKGDHTFMLVIPEHAFIKDDMTVDEFYDLQEFKRDVMEKKNKERKRLGLPVVGWAPIYYTSECTVCGKKKWSSERD